MTTILKAAYIMIICLFVLHIAVQVDSRTFFILSNFILYFIHNFSSLY